MVNPVGFRSRNIWERGFSLRLRGAPREGRWPCLHHRLDLGKSQNTRKRRGADKQILKVSSHLGEKTRITGATLPEFRAVQQSKSNQDSHARTDVRTGARWNRVGSPETAFPFKVHRLSASP